MVKYNFATQILWSEKQERIVCDILLSKFRRRVISVEYCKNKLYDILFDFEDGTSITFEVKADVACGDIVRFGPNGTGYVAIEFISNGKSSGIASTQADFWVQAVKTPANMSKRFNNAEWVYYWISVKALRELLNVTKEGPDLLNRFLNVTYARKCSNISSGDACPTRSFLLDLVKHVHLSGKWMRLDLAQDSTIL